MARLLSHQCIRKHYLEGSMMGSAINSLRMEMLFYLSLISLRNVTNCLSEASCMHMDENRGLWALTAICLTLMHKCLQLENFEKLKNCATIARESHTLLIFTTPSTSYPTVPKVVLYSLLRFLSKMKILTGDSHRLLYPSLSSRFLPTNKISINPANFISCAVKACKSSSASFPLHFRDAELVQIELEYNPEFITNMLPRIEWPALVTIASELGFTTLPPTKPEGAGLDEKTKKDLHTLLLETQVTEGKLCCANCGHEYKIHQGIANFLLPSHLGGFWGGVVLCWLTNA